MAQDINKKASFFSREKDEAMVARMRAEFASKERRKKHKRGVQILFAVSLVVTLLLSTLNWGVVTGWGQVKVSRLTLSGTNGDKLSMVYGDVEKGISEEEMVNLSNTWIQAKRDRGYAGYDDITYVKTDELVGSFENGDAFMASIDTARVHEAAFVTQETIGKLVDFAQQAADYVPNYIDSADQVWMAKDCLGMFAVFSFGVWICALALLLIEVIPFFNEVRRAPTRNIGLRGLGMAISLILGVVLPFIVLKTASMGIVELLLPGAGGPPDFVQGRAPFHLTYANISISLNTLDHHKAVQRV